MGNIPKCRLNFSGWWVGLPASFFSSSFWSVYCYYYDLTFLDGESLDIRSYIEISTVHGKKKKNLRAKADLIVPLAQ
jgi:hypothetical protein